MYGIHSGVWTDLSSCRAEAARSGIQRRTQARQRIRPVRGGWQTKLAFSFLSCHAKKSMHIIGEKGLNAVDATAKHTKPFDLS